MILNQVIEKYLGTFVFEDLSAPYILFFTIRNSSFEHGEDKTTVKTESNAVVQSKPKPKRIRGGIQKDKHEKMKQISN